MTTTTSHQVKRRSYAAPKASKTVHCMVFSHTWTDDLGAGDITEIGVLPAGCRPLRVSVTTENLAAATVDVGIMSGTPEDEETTRTVGDEFVAAGAANATLTADEATCVAIAPEATDRGIGIALSDAETVNGTQAVTLVVEYFSD